MISMIPTAIDGVMIIEPRVFNDARGYFFESYSDKDFNEQLQATSPYFAKYPTHVNFVQDNESMSSYGVMRGLHFQRPPFTQSKLVRVVKGAVLDVAVDIRKGSPTYGQHVACLLAGSDIHAVPSTPSLQSIPEAELTAAMNRQFFVPRGFAHGFAVLSETAVFQYKCDNFYAPQADDGISILDSSLGIDWKIPTDNALLSEKDTHHDLLKDFTTPFDFNIALY